MTHIHNASGRPKSAVPELRWQLLDDLTAARDDWGLKDRTLGVLRALLSFLPKGERLRLTVFPSNRTLAERLHGMPESTLRRHLAKLAEVGLIHRVQSPNGKRYRIGTDLVFGLDLSPLFALAQDLRKQAVEALAHQTRLRELRQRLRLAIERAYIAADTQIETLRLLRRKVPPQALEAELARIEADVPPKTDVAAAQNECHINTKTESNINQSDQSVALDALEEIATLTKRPVRSEQDLKEVGEFAAGLLSVQDAWTFAQRTHGSAWATMALAYIMRRHKTLRKPNRYLHTLTERAGAGGFDLIAALRPKGTFPCAT